MTAAIDHTTLEHLQVVLVEDVPVRPIHVAAAEHISDVTDRRRMLLAALFGADIGPTEADAVFGIR